MKKHAIISVALFILLVPFRLPISVLLIKLFTYIASTTGEILPDDIMAANVCVTKGFYTAIVSFALILSIKSLLHHYIKDKYHADNAVAPFIFVLHYLLTSN